MIDDLREILKASSVALLFVLVILIFLGLVDSYKTYTISELIASGIEPADAVCAVERPGPNNPLYAICIARSLKKAPEHESL